MEFLLNQIRLWCASKQRFLMLLFAIAVPNLMTNEPVLMFSHFEQTGAMSHANDAGAAAPSTKREKTLSTFNTTSVFSYPPLELNNSLLSSTTSPVANLLKIYFVQDELPHEYTRDIETYLYNFYLGGGESNHKAELALIQLFRTYPGRTFNKNEADIIFVPYPHAGHCQMHGYFGRCENKQIQLSQFFKLLPNYRRPKFRKKYLFMALQDVDHMRPKFYTFPFKLFTGPRPSSSLGSIILPTMNDWTCFQPSSLLARGDEWWTRPRKYAFSYFYAETRYAMEGNNNNTIKNTNTRRFRTYFRQDLESYGQNTLGGLPFRHEQMTNGNVEWTQVRQIATTAYMDSLFCPILSGDYAWQSRFFDAILCGCLPVVLSWNLTSTKQQREGGENNNTHKSWFLPSYNTFPHTSDVMDTYPFYKGVFGNGNGDMDEIEVDYESFVVECPGNEEEESDVSILRKTMEDLLLHSPDEIVRRQMKLRESVLAFSFGLGDDAHRYNDAFARLIHGLKNYVDRNLRRS